MEGRHELQRASVLLVTGDQELHHEVRRVAAGVGVPVEVIADPGDALTSWRRATLVLVGGDCAVSMSRLRPSRRSGVSVVSARNAPSDVFRSAFDLGAAQVLELPTTEDWLVEALAESGMADPEQGLVVGLLSAAGGAGGSCLAVATACLGAERAATALVDLDPVGVGIERLIGYDGVSVTTWDTLGSRALSPHVLRDALPAHDGVHLVGFGSSPPSPVGAPEAAVVLAACPQAFGLTVVDLPRSLAAATVDAIERCDLVVVICPQTVAATLSGHRLVASLRTTKPVMVITRAGPRTVDAADVADALGLPLLAEVGDQRGLDEALATGAGPLRSRGAGLRKAAHAVLDQLKLST